MADRLEGIADRPASTAAPDLLSQLPRLNALPALQDCFEFFQRERRWINERHLDLCRIPALTFREQQRAAYLKQQFQKVGLKAAIDEAGNVVAPLVFQKKAPFVAVTAHLDTTLAPRQSSDIFVRPDGCFQGPGVTDNGAGLAALLALAGAFQRNRPFREAARNLLLVANVAEEGEGNLYGMKYLCGHSPYAEAVEAYLVLDGASVAHITAEALGSRRFEITLEGRGGHSWNDFGRANPVHALARAVANMADVELPDSPRATLTVGVMEGGSGVNSIAPLARAKVDIRSRGSDAMDAVVSAMEQAVRQAVEVENRRSRDSVVSYRIREIGRRPAAAAIERNVLLECVQAVDAHLGIRSRLDCASTDANVPLSLGIPAVAIGAGGHGGEAHAPAEWYSPEGRELGLRRILLALALLLQPRV